MMMKPKNYLNFAISQGSKLNWHGREQVVAMGGERYGEGLTQLLLDFLGCEDPEVVAQGLVGHLLHVLLLSESRVEALIHS